MNCNESECGYRLENARIGRIGLFYLGHYKQPSVRVELDGRGWGSTVTIPTGKIGKFVEMFDDELEGNVEDGVYVEELNGKPVRVMFEGNDICSSVIGIGDILSNEDDMLILR